MQTRRFVSVIVMFGALSPMTAQAATSSTRAVTTRKVASPATTKAKSASKVKRKAPVQKRVFAGNGGAPTSRRLKAGEKAAILAGTMVPPTTEIVCPPSVNMRTFNPKADYPGKDYGSFLAMRGGDFGYVVREWLNGCEQRLSFPKAQEDNAPYSEPEGDYKPTYSPDGQHIAFFRRSSGQEATSIPEWKTRTTVIDSDGGNARYLSDVTTMNSNPMWTRKQFPNPSTGKLGYRVTWTHITPSGAPLPVKMEGCWNDVDARSNPGQQRCFTDAYPYQWAYSSLADGRILVRREGINQLNLVTPNEQNSALSTYQPLSFASTATPTGPTVLWHKISISQDETKITFMKVPNATPLEVATTGGFNNSQLAYADFDAKTGTISNEHNLTTVNLARVAWYSMFTKHDKQLLFACHGPCPIGDGSRTENSPGQVYEYDFATKTFTRISHHQTDNAVDAGRKYRQKGNEYRYPNIWGVVK